jgi:hypothetical protein
MNNYFFFLNVGGLSGIENRKSQKKMISTTWRKIPGAVKRINTGALPIMTNMTKRKRRTIK